MLEEERYDSDEPTVRPPYSATAYSLKAVGVFRHKNKNASMYESAITEVCKKTLGVKVPVFTTADLAALFRDSNVKLDDRDQAAFERCVDGGESLTHDLAMPLYDPGFRFDAKLTRLSSLTDYGLETPGLKTDCTVSCHNHDFGGDFIVCPE